VAESTPEQVEVVLLGTYHMDEPEIDEVNISGTPCSPTSASGNSKRSFDGS